MRLPAILDGVPRIVFVLAIPVVAFIVAAGISLGRGGSSTDNSPPASSNVSVSLAPSQATAQPTPTAAPTSTSQPNRANCTTIRGTPYQSEAEREWFQKNCGAATPTAGTGGSGSTTTTTQSAPSQPSSSTAGVQAPAASAGCAETPIGDTLVIPRIGVNAPVSKACVDGSGYMPDPHGYFNVVWYDFSAIPGLGGYVGNGNLVAAGHVDCAGCVNGGPGLAVFYYTRNMVPGDTAQYYTRDGKVFNYVVTSSVDYDAYSNWGAIVSSGAADMTLITCGGVFNAATHEYNLRHVVTLRLI